MAAWCGIAGDDRAAVRTSTQLPGESAKFYFFELTAGAGAVGWPPLVGVVGLVFVAPWITLGVAQHPSWRWPAALLGPSAGPGPRRSR